MQSHWLILCISQSETSSYGEGTNINDCKSIIKWIFRLSIYIDFVLLLFLFFSPDVLHHQWIEKKNLKSKIRLPHWIWPRAMKFDNSKIPEGRKSRLMNDLFVDQLHLCICWTWRAHHLIGNRNAALRCLKVRWIIWLTAPRMNWTGGLGPGDWRSFWWLDATTPLFDDQTLPLAPRRLCMGPKKDTVRCLFVSYSFSFFLPSLSLPREIRLVRLSIEQVILKNHDTAI